MCVKSEDSGGLYCPVGGNEGMANVAAVLGREAIAKDPEIAVLLCNGSCQVRPEMNRYDGAPNCMQFGAPS